MRSTRWRRSNRARTSTELKNTQRGIQDGFSPIWNNTSAGGDFAAGDGIREPIMRNRSSSRLTPGRCLAVVSLFTVISGGGALIAQGPYKVLDRWKLTDSGWWDYLNVDPAGHRLYVTRGDHVDVLDTATGKLVAAIASLHGIHGVALDDAGKFGYISDGAANAVVVFDRTTFATVSTIPVGQGPDSIVFEPATHTVWAFNGHSKDISVIDAALPGGGASPSWKVVATIALPGRPEAPAVDGKGLVFDNIEDKSEIVRVDARARQITATWPLTGCEGPSGLAVDPVGRRLFPVCDKKMAVVDADTGKVLSNPDIGDGPDAAGWDAKHKLAFASCGQGVLSVIDAGKPDTPTIESLPTQRGARTMAYDAAADRIYLVTAEFGPRPEPTAENPRPRPPMIPGSFVVLVVGR
jgi:DNA-binding beta-propeller fold protein YncE